MGGTRAGNAESAHTTRAALRRGLDGRGISTAKNGPATTSPALRSKPASTSATQRRDEDKAQTVEQIVGDEELFVVQKPAPAVIERSEEKVHAKRPGPALGRG